MVSRAHPTAVIDPAASLGDDVAIGPFCYVGAGVRLLRGVELISHVAVLGDTEIGARTKIYPFAAVGAPSQDLKSIGEEGRLVVGADCIIREGVTITGGARARGGATRIGDGCALLAHCHVAHDCRLGERVVLSNNVALGGHVELGDHVIIGGGSAVHQHARIGAHAFVAGLSGVEGDAPPFTLVGGNRAHLFGLNVVGLERRGFSKERMARLWRAYRTLYAREAPASLEERLAQAAALVDDDGDIAQLLAFFRAPAKRPLLAPRPSPER